MLKKFSPARRLNLTAYPFAELERKAAAIRQSGKPLYDLSIGDPDLPPPEYVVNTVKNALDNHASHRYPSSRGDREVRESVAAWFSARFKIELDPETQVCITIGAKEALANIAKAVVNPGDIVGFTEPGYPVYQRAGCVMLDAIPKKLDITSKNSFLPDLTSIQNVRLLYLNYPNNPTGAEATDTFMEKVGRLADSDPSMTVAWDMAYGEVCFDKPARSILEFTPNAVEFHSLSKMANATGYRVGFAVGDPDKISALVRAKQELDSGAPLPFQLGLAAMLDRYRNGAPPDELQDYKEKYRLRKNKLLQALDKSGIQLFKSNATFYLWFRVGEDEMPFIKKALEFGVLLTPGSGFGQGGKGWVRASVTTSDESIDMAAEILSNLEWGH